MKVSIVGLGKLGAPMAAVYASKGHDVIGVDKHTYFVDSINAKKAPFYEAQLQEFIEASGDHLKATTNMDEAILNSDITFIIVPTPSDSNGIFTNQYVLNAIIDMGPALQRKNGYHLVVITSTVMPGSTNGIIRQTLEHVSGKTVGNDLGLCYSPEFIALGSVIHDMLNPDFFLIGESDDKAGSMLQSIYSQTCNNTPEYRRMNTVNAEITKISVNTYVTTKISYANMISDICDRLEGADVDVVNHAVGADRRIGSFYLRGAVAYGGPCFPRDNIAFSKMARQIGANASLAEATDNINKSQKERLAYIVDTLNAKKVAILGLSYKPGTPVIEESQGIGLALHLINQGCDVTVFDPLALTPAQSILQDKVTYGETMEDAVRNQDVVVIMTASPEYRHLEQSMMNDHTQIIDCWRIVKSDLFNHVIYLGNGYLASLENVQKKVANA
jgi:UDPglucose 6-dehydrogenase